MSETNRDLEQLLELVTSMANGNYTYAKADNFSDPNVACVYNEMVDSIMYRNNYFLVRINDAQSRIADTSTAKSMLESLEAQSEPIAELKKARGAFAESLSKSTDFNIEALALIKQMQNTFEACETYGRRSIRQLTDALEAPNIKTVEDIKNEISEALISMKNENDLVSSMLPHINSIKGDIADTYNEIEVHQKDARIFLDDADSIIESYVALHEKCYDAGRQLFRISRDIDNARNDMFRHNSWPLLHDRLKVFAVDHITLAWRLYNNAVGFEKLRFDQVNDPENCKFGKWCVSQTDPELISSEAFTKAVFAHGEFHRYAISSFLAKEANHVDEAIEEFKKLLAANEVLQDAIEGLHEYFRSKGITKETEVWKYQGL